MLLTQSAAASGLGHFEKKLPVGQVVGYTAETCLDEAGGRTQNGLLAKSSPKHLFLQVKYRGLAGVTGVRQLSEIKDLDWLTLRFGRTGL